MFVKGDKVKCIKISDNVYNSNPQIGKIYTVDFIHHDWLWAVRDDDMYGATDFLCEDFVKILEFKYTLIDT